MNAGEVSLLLSLGIGLEVSAYPKPGNVHRLYDFHDIRFEDFIITSHVFQKYLTTAVKRGFKIEKKRNKVIYGDVIYQITKCSMEIHGGGNVCLGTSILLVPIAVACGYIIYRNKELKVNNILKYASELVRKYSTIADAVYLYRAIRRIRPSYIRKSDDTGEFPNVYVKNYCKLLREKKLRFWDVLKASIKRDIISFEVINMYSNSMDAHNFLINRLSSGIDWNNAVVDTYLYILSKGIDTMVIREHGEEKMKYISKNAKEILDLGGSSTNKGYELLTKLDRELREKGINPGSSADITATAISIYTSTHKKQIIHS